MEIIGMANRLKEMGESSAWRLMVGAALRGAEENGFKLVRKPGRGLSNTWELTKGGKTRIASVRTTRDRWIAFPPLNSGKNWKTLDDVELVLVSAVDDRLNPQNVDVYLFPADEVRKRFDDSYAARMAAGHTVRDDYGMWVMLDQGDINVPGQVGCGLAADYPAIARYSLDELQASNAEAAREVDSVAPDAAEQIEPATVGEVLAWARTRIADLSGVSTDAIKLDLRIEA
jgi:hypothetical protein